MDVINRSRIDIYSGALAMNPYYAFLQAKYSVGGSILNDKSLNDSQRKSFNLDIDEMIISCVFGVSICNGTDFVWTYDMLFGSCWEFNSNKNGNRILNISKPGILDGFYIELYLGESTNKYSLNHEAGFLFYVRNQSQSGASYEGKVF